MKTRQIIFFGAEAVCVVFLVNLMLTFYFQQKTVPLPEAFDVIIVPGEGAYQGMLPANNDTIGMDVLARLDYAASLFANQTEKPIIILSGYGRWYKERPLEDRESVLMYGYLLHRLNNMPEAAVHLIKENQSHNTIENAIYSRQKIPGDAPRILVLATSKAYERTAMVFKTVLHTHEVTVVSLRAQREDERKKEVLVTLGSRLILALPTESLELWVNAKVYKLIRHEVPLNESSGGAETGNESQY